MPSLVFALFFVAFVAIGLLNVFKPRAMMRWRLKTRYGIDGEVEPSDTRLLIHRLVALFVLLVGVVTMVSWVGV